MMADFFWTLTRRLFVAGLCTGALAVGLDAVAPWMAALIRLLPGSQAVDLSALAFLPSLSTLPLTLPSLTWALSFALLIAMNICLFGYVLARVVGQASGIVQTLRHKK